MWQSVIKGVSVALSAEFYQVAAEKAGRVAAVTFDPKTYVAGQGRKDDQSIIRWNCSLG